MEFHTQGFALFFLIFFVGFWSIPWHRPRMLWLLVGSIVFYMHTVPWHILLILGSASVDYFVGLRLEAESRPGVRRGLLLLSVLVNLGLLCFFKYTNFLLDQVDAVLAAWGTSAAAWRLDLVLPLGISFYTFETISYIVDVYQRKFQPVRSLLDYALYILFFPHLLAGPIVRGRDFLPQLARPKRFRWQRLQVGAWLFLLGLFKKAVIADHIAGVVRPVFADPGGYGSFAIWLGVVGFALQIYCDFSGYTDMARGLAQTLGFHLPLNFRLPYLAADIAEFWHRWHISLSTWLRDYVYIPLGGSRQGEFTTCRNLLLTMLIGGLWHGPKWTMVVWGAYHGLLLVLHRRIHWPAWLRGPVGKGICVAATFLLVCVGWVFFRAESLANALLMLHRMFVWANSERTLSEPLLLAAGLNLGLLLLYLLAAPRLARVRWEQHLPVPVSGMLLGLLLALALLLVPDQRQPFIYFQF